MPLLKAETLCRCFHRFRTFLLAFLLMAAPAKLLMAQSSVTAPAGYEPCASSASGMKPVIPSFSVQNTLNALYKPAAGSPVMVSVHRGYWQNAPENSMSALYAAAANGFPISEADVYQTQSNGQVVLSHDNDVARTTTGTGLISGMSAKTYTSLFLRDRHGCPTNEHPVTLQDALNDLFVNQQVYVEDGELYGEVLVLDIKSSSASAMYQSLLEAINEWEENGIVGYGPVQSVIFKVPMYFSGQPVMPTPEDCDSKGNCGYDKFIDDIKALVGDNISIPNMIYVLYAPSSIDPTDPYFQNYDDQPWTYSGGGTLGFETHERYINDQATAIRQYLQKEGRAVGTFSADNMFPEGEPYLNVCCTHFNLNFDPSISPPQPGCLSAGFQKCFDERVRWDLLSQLDAGLITTERPTDVKAYFAALGEEGSVTQITAISLPPPSSATCGDPGTSSDALCQ